MTAGVAPSRRESATAPALPSGQPSVAVLFARADSVYFDLPNCDVYDAARDARTFAGGVPVVAHPPCRTWSRLRSFANAPSAERDLAPWSVDVVRRWGGVLEHPAGSFLWQALGLPPVGLVDRGFTPARDRFGGWSLVVPQFWWGHRAHKSTWLYICGVQPRELPALPFVLGRASHTLGLFSGRDRSTARPEVSKRERDASPPAFARWLVDLAVGASVASAGVVTPAEVSRVGLSGVAGD